MCGSDNINQMHNVDIRMLYSVKFFILKIFVHFIGWSMAMKIFSRENSESMQEL